MRWLGETGTLSTGRDFRMIVSGPWSGGHAWFDREAELPPLIAPTVRQILAENKMLGGEFGRLPTIKNGLDNIGGQESEP